MFPLNAVLFPTALLPLHIFEERYKRLISGCVSSAEEFGVNLMDTGKVHEVGCSARVVEIVTKYNDGRFDIVIQGMRRYRVGAMDAESQPWLVSDVDWFDDERADVDAALLRRVLDLYNELVETVYGGTIKTLTLEDLTGGAAYKMAQKAGLELQERQHILTLDGENTRLTYLETYLNEVLPKVRDAERVQGIIRNDGYL